MFVVVVLVLSYQCCCCHTAVLHIAINVQCLCAPNFYDPSHNCNQSSMECFVYVNYNMILQTFVFFYLPMNFILGLRLTLLSLHI